MIFSTTSTCTVFRRVIFQSSESPGRKYTPTYATIHIQKSSVFMSLLISDGDMSSNVDSSTGITDAKTTVYKTEKNEFFVQMTYGERSAHGGGVAGITSFFQMACQRPEFAMKCHGFESPCFMKNSQLIPGNEALEKFNDGVRDLNDDAILGLVFHGTPSQNIAVISSEGLDPKKRSGQAYGPGEYFSKDPGVSVRYCRRGNAMMVFVVVIPQDSVSSMAMKHPFVVVNNNSHQLPIGTLIFSRVDKIVMDHSKRLRDSLFKLSQEVDIRIKAAEEAEIKAEIIQSLIAMKIDAASQTYNEHRSNLSELSKRELAWYVKISLVDDVRSAAFFPGLPEPMNNIEMSQVTVENADHAAAHVTRVQHELTVLEKTEGAKKSRLLLHDEKQKFFLHAQKQKKWKQQLNATSVYADIMECLSAQRLDVASELYMRHGSVLDACATREIARKIRCCVDEDLVPVLFPDLPACEESINSAGLG
jgi:Poly(ADP-ribose) polymerase catalytic domain